MEIIIILLIAISTSIASGLHGNDFGIKGVIMACHALFIGGCLFYLDNPWYLCLTAILISAYYWFMFRGGKQARAQLDASTLNHPGKTLAQAQREAAYAYILPVALAFAFSIGCFVYSSSYFWALGSLLLIPTPLVSYAAVKIFNYNTKIGKQLGWTPGTFLDCRRAVELTTGLLLSGINIGFITIAVSIAF